MVVNPPAAETLFEHFEIEFDAGAEPIFHGGELVTGSLKIQLKNEATINSIRLQFRGRAVFINPAGNKKSTESQTEKVYFDKDFVLLERPPGHPEPGHFPWNANFLYSLPFECPLPKGCETSYEGPHGFIRYYARVILETEEPYKAQYLVKKAFSIISSPELHQLVAPYSEPIAEKKSMRFGGCCCRSRMNAEIYLPKSAYAPGENIVGTFRMDPRTAKNAIEHIEVRLVDRLHRILDQPEASATTAENDHNAASDETTPMIETDGAKKGKKEKQPKKKGRNEGKQQQQKEQPLCQRVVTGRKLTKEDMGRGGTGPQMEQTTAKGGPQMVTQTNVFFIRIPAVAPSTQIEKERKPHQSMLFDELVDGENAENGQFHRLLESPSTATLRARKEPFLRVDYALQISFGNHVLMELPIQVHPIPIYAKGIQFRPFAGGAQPIGEPDESSQIPFNAPFTFTPQYPMYLESPKPMEVDGDGHIIDEAQQITILAPANGGAEMVAVSNGVAAQGGGSGPAKVVLTKSTAEMQIPTVPLVVIKEGTVEEGQQQNSAQLQQGVAEHELNKSPNEMDGRQMGEETAENGRPSTTTTVPQPNGEGAEGGTRTTTTTDIADEPPSSTGLPPPPVEHKHDEQFEQLANGHTLHTSTDEWIQKNGNGGEDGADGKEVRRVVQEEHYEIQNEDGSRVSVQKTVEKISSMETRVVENGEENGEKGQNGKEGGGGGEDGTNTTNSNDQQQQQLQMDISMSG